MERKNPTDSNSGFEMWRAVAIVIGWPIGVISLYVIAELLTK